MLIKDNITNRDNNIFIKNPDFKDIDEIIINKIVNISSGIQLLLAFFLQLSFLRHRVYFITIYSQMSKL